MACILYRIENGKIIQESVEAIDVSNLLTKGYSPDPARFSDKPKRAKIAAKKKPAAAKDEQD